MINGGDKIPNLYMQSKSNDVEKINNLYLVPESEKANN